MSDTPRSRRISAQADDTETAEDTGSTVKRPEAEPPASRHPAPGPLPRRDSDRFADGPPDPLASLLAKVTNGETIPTPGSRIPGARSDDEERDPREEEWREHDRHGPYAQGRRRRN
ncbi:hypothetical protein [Streptomyces qinglanensis]|uniref:hypothetical protein n=1 Tax=Streptomyces qinglanensis TaxID=943816 RepID=UPI003D727E97